MYSNNIPGVIETDYSQKDIEENLNIKYDRHILQNEAVKFCLQQNEKTLLFVKQNLIQLKFNRFSAKKLFNFIYGSTINSYREYYQKLCLFKLFKNN